MPERGLRFAPSRGDAASGFEGGPGYGDSPSPVGRGIRGEVHTADGGEGSGVRSTPPTARWVRGEVNAYLSAAIWLGSVSQ